MNPLNPPPAGTDPIAAAQMQLLQQMANTMKEMQAQMRQERQEMHKERQEIRQEMRQERQEMRQVRQEQQQLPPPPPPAPPRDKHQEFMSHKPPTFSNSSDPLQANDWLKSVDKMLNIAQCSDWEKVLYASGRLTGPDVDWWDAYCAAHATVNTITWAEFSTQFRNYNIPTGLMKIKKEFLSLKQGGM
jgi:E3 ubiquitin-protein ligase DOA10